MRVGMCGGRKLGRTCPGWRGLPGRCINIQGCDPVPSVGGRQAQSPMRYRLYWVRSALVAEGTIDESAGQHRHANTSQMPLSTPRRSPFTFLRLLGSAQLPLRHLVARYGTRFCFCSLRPAASGSCHCHLLTDRLPQCPTHGHIRIPIACRHSHSPRAARPPATVNPRRRVGLAFLPSSHRVARGRCLPTR